MTKSPSAAGRSTPTSVPNRERSCCISLVDVLVGHLGVGHLDPQALPVGQRHRRPNVDFDGELEFLAVGEVGDVDLRLAERAQLVVLDGLAVELGQAPR